MQKVFVYGTLKKGFHNHWLVEASPFQTAEAHGFELHTSGSLPFAMKGEGIINGELYEVTEQQLFRLDTLEGHPSFYRRSFIKVLLPDGAEDNAWIYLRPQAREFPKIESGIWE